MTPQALTKKTQPNDFKVSFRAQEGINLTFKSQQWKVFILNFWNKALFATMFIFDLI